MQLQPSLRCSLCKPWMLVIQSNRHRQAPLNRRARKLHVRSAWHA
jgi:hypothetical protein